KAGDESARISAMNHLGLRGEAAAEAVPVLSELLKDPSARVRAHAARALGLIGDPAKVAAQQLVQAVGDESPEVRRSAVLALRVIRPGPKVTLPLFLKLIEQGDPALRHRALNALADAGEEAVPFLIEATKNEKAAYWAVLVLADIGPKAKDAVPALTALLNSQAPEVRREAILALAAIGEAAAPSTPQIAKMLGDEHAAAAATYALVQIGKVPNDALPTIRANSKAEDKVLRAVSLWALARSDGSKETMTEAAGSLIDLLKDPDQRVRQAAARALSDLKPGPDIALPLFQKALDGATDAVVLGALDAIASVGPEAVPALTKALAVESARPRVIYILGQIGPEAKDAVPALVKYIDVEDPKTQQETLIALGKIGPAAADAVPAIVAALKKHEGGVSYSAAYALGKIGPDAAAAEEALLAAVESKDESLALLSAWALAKVHPTCPNCAARSVPVLIRGLADPATQYRYQAAEGLKAWGKLAAPAKEALLKATQDTDAAVRKAAKEALAAIGG
ncbi:MAG: HEAT repeat domain-containing protein, partial [Planctomycetota bacterium]